MKNKISFVLISLLLMSCNSNKMKKVEPSKNQEIENLTNIKRIWMLVQFNDFSKEYLIKKGAFLDLTNAELASAKMGCNNLSFAYKVNSNSEIVFSNGIATRMYCEDMKLEDEFAKELLNYTSYKIDGHKLILLSSKEKKMEYIAQDWD